MYRKKDLTKKARVKKRIRAKIAWTPERPRLSVYKSNKFVTAQLIDDINWKTLAASSFERNMKWAVKLWKDISWKAKVKTIVFDRNWFLYHWVVKQIADSAREWWLKF